MKLVIFFFLTTFWEVEASGSFKHFATLHAMWL